MGAPTSVCLLPSTASFQKEERKRKLLVTPILWYPIPSWNGHVPFPEISIAPSYLPTAGRGRSHETVPGGGGGGRGEFGPWFLSLVTKKKSWKFMS